MDSVSGNTSSTGMDKMEAPNDKGSRNPSIFSELNTLVYEYLNITGMNNTLSSFLTECEDKSLPCPPKETTLKSTFTQADSNQLLRSFDTGDVTIFKQKWDLFLSHIQITSDDMKKLEVYLYVYFGLWPKANGRSEEAQLKAMASLKAYFEENSAELSKDPTVLPLFALPFVHDPKTHPVFKELLQEVWSDRLRSQLEATLLKYFELLQENIGHHSKLAAVVLRAHYGNDKKLNGSNGTTDAIIHYHQERFFQLMNTYRKVRKLLRGTRESYGKLLKVSNEMISGLEDAANGTVMSVEPTLQKCFNIFPELFTPELDISGKPDKEYFKRLAGAAIFNNILDSDVSLFFIGISDLGPESLNYPKIKETLVSDQVSQSHKLCLLQALRWLLTKTFPRCREYAMDAFTGADLLGLNSKDKEFRSKLFACMLTQTPTYMKECFARLLNAFASVKSGRSYLASNTHTLDVLVTSLVTCKGQNESYICQMIIATLQKMSLRKEMRLGMIERKVIQWLAVYLKAELARKQTPLLVDNGNVEVGYNPYLMEYGWALLMNLCLHEEAKPASSAYASDILTSVVQMLYAKPTPDVAPYVVSTLYSLLRNPDVFAIAKRMCLQDSLTEIIGNSKTEMAHHLRKLVEVLNLKGYDRITTTGEVDYDDDDNADPEEFEPELEVSEGWTSALDKGSHVGDDLLVREYLIHREIVLPESPLIPKNQMQGVHTRPTTPKSFFIPNQGPGITPCQPIKSSRPVPTAARRDSIASKKGTTSTASVTSHGKRNETPKRKIQGSESSTLALSKVVSSSNASGPKPGTPPQVQPPVSVSTTNSTKSKLKSTGSDVGMMKKKAPQARFELHEADKRGNYYNGNAILNLVKGNYKDFDDEMFTDDIFASVSSSPVPLHKSKSTSKEIVTLSRHSSAAQEQVNRTTEMDDSSSNSRNHKN